MENATGDLGSSWIRRLKTQVRNTEQEHEFYEDTGSHYEEAMTQLEFTGPKRCVGSLIRFESETGVSIPRDALILDMGAGTGLAGLAMREAGFQGQMDALEPSDAMFSRAIPKNIYAKRYSDFLYPDKTTTVPENNYDVVISSAVFSPRSVTFDCIPEYIRVVKREGFISALLGQNYWQNGFEAEVETVEQKGLVICEKVYIYEDYYKNGEPSVNIILRKA